MAPQKSSASILFTLWLVVFASASQVMIVAPILPRISEELGVPVASLGTLATAYAVSVGLFALVTGPISDRVGRRRILIWGSLVLTVALVLHGVVRSFGSLLLVRSLAGAGGGALSGAAVAFVGDYFPSNRRGWANGWIISGMAAGQIAGIPLGLVLTSRGGFRVPFLAFAGLMAVATVLVWRVIPHIPIRKEETQLTLRGAIRGYMGLLRMRTVVVASIAFLLVFLSISLYILYLPVWLESSLGLTAVSVSLVFVVGGVANVLVGPRLGRLSDSLGRKPVIVGASFGITIVMLLTPLAILWPWSIFGLFAGVQALFASRSSPFQSLLTELVSSDQRGSLLSFTMATGQVGFAIGGALAGFIYSTLGFGMNAALSALAALAAAVLVWRYLPETLPQGAPELPAITSAEKDPCAPLWPQGDICGPCPEAGHMARSLQESCAEKAARYADLTAT